ncbi:hypothetical protein Y032_0259g477 [Ancylostoma ceylanicum]|uniref:Uncharacterized protein n=1 Tax=Ancylostoma ceylanicum TaxID=53326 RepID=A0A016SB40_9BILA|nr:hypothetical protein Y032_0259g477 [Ancylostoma ceylanicum]
MGYCHTGSLQPTIASYRSSWHTPTHITRKTFPYLMLLGYVVVNTLMQKIMYKPHNVFIMNDRTKSK